MPVPFAEFVIPPVGYTVGVLVVTGLVFWGLSRVRPPVTQATVLALAPWMVVGAVLHVLWQLEQSLATPIVPSVAEPLLSAPTVYVATFCLAGPAWLGLSLVQTLPARLTVSRALGLAGLGALGALIGVMGARVQAASLSGVTPGAPLVGLLAAVGVTGVGYGLISRWQLGTVPIDRVRYAGGLVLFAHAFDATTTAIGVELLDVEERSAAPRAIMNVAATLPTEPLLGEAWLFIVVKLFLAVGIVVGFAEYAEESPTWGNLFYALIAAVGLGPAANNFFLFIINTPG
ncbi:MAG: putative membrane protein [halophilic archaeon J07HX5]|jgi:Predicted membrane protein|nr:MAG: putative membrane protein [halophilic archaeon J07HX5]